MTSGENIHDAQERDELGLGRLDLQGRREGEDIQNKTGKPHPPPKVGYAHCEIARIGEDATTHANPRTVERVDQRKLKNEAMKGKCEERPRYRTPLPHPNKDRKACEDLAVDKELGCGLLLHVRH